ncbi:putative recombinase [Asanoa ishikariensis]|uniref:Recombinase zinc beta ribbon domain-containing protein n=1 Tax=Asanoa ishikariensis TaxID=137265 RepID=A0A1H3U774_9ACTN|nr:putative recombinase [Asanoa ishikariensis]SDZ58334.1 Recombinase zinc beta ribbon domain-containing protein [Asanoa ishikariensis]
MSSTTHVPAAGTGDSRLASWLCQTAARPRTRGPRLSGVLGRALRFAFYGRTSTEQFQDPVSSREWQRDNAVQLIDGHGQITVEFFDIGYSRALPWQHRPAAAALLRSAAQPDRTFDAVVIGEFERAFTAGHARSITAQLNAYGISVWLAELDGPVDLSDSTHQAVLQLLGHQAQREVLRARRRTTAAMAAQVRTQGRHLGGRPPYGYRLVDAGPHPNVQHARWGRRLQRLDLDPDTAAHVEWMFAQRLAGHSTAGIARALNARGVPPPSAHDRARNPHRSGTAWTLRTVASILANPRYTGRQVWNRQSVDHHETRPGDTSRLSRGGRPTRGWNPRDQWEISPPGAHPALVSEADFLRVQQVTALAAPDDGNVNRYQLTGLVICGICGRRAEGHWVHGRARYRCRHGHTSANAPRPDRPKTLYVREDHLLEQARAQLSPRAAERGDGSNPAGLAAQLRVRGITIVCTAVSVTLDIGLDDPKAGWDNPTSAAGDQRQPDQLTIPGLTIPQPTRNPHRRHPRNVNTFGGG